MKKLHKEKSNIFKRLALYCTISLAIAGGINKAQATELQNNNNIENTQATKQNKNLLSNDELKAKINGFIHFIRHLEKNNSDLADKLKKDPTEGFKYFLELSAKAEKEKNRSTGYSEGKTSFSYYINADGGLNLRQHSKTPVGAYDKDIKLINESMSRARGLGVDRIGGEFEASNFITNEQVRRDILDKAEEGKIVPNGRKFIEVIDQEIADNGMEIDIKTQRLKPTEENMQKELKTEAQLLEEYKQQQAIELQQFRNQRGG